MTAPVKPRPFSDDEIRQAYRMRAERPRRTWQEIAEALGRETPKGITAKLDRLRDFHGVESVEDYDRHIAAGRKDRLNAAAIAAPARKAPKPKPKAKPKAKADARQYERAPSQVGPTFVAPRHANVEDQRAEQRRAQAHAERMTKARPQSEEELCAAIEKHLAEKGATKCPTMGQHDFSTVWEKLGLQR